MKTVHTTCQICLATCGIEVTVDDDNHIRRIAPDKQNPYNWRDFCGKGRTAHELVEHPQRILAPMKRVGDRYVEASWEEAIEDIASRLRQLMDHEGPDSIGVFWGTGAGPTSTNVITAGFMDAIGTRQRYWPGSVDQNALHVVAEHLYGSPLLMLVPDLDHSDCFLLIGMNPVASAFNWLYNAPNGWRRVLARRAQGADVIVVDPRRTRTAERADTHVAIRPGQDWAFLLAIVKIIFDNGWEHREDCDRLNGLERLRELLADCDLDDLSRRCDVPRDQLADVARRFAQARTAFCDAHTGVSQTATGTLGVWLATVLNIVTGRIDRPGGWRYERGYVPGIGLFEKLAPPIREPSRVRRLAPVVGHRAVAELADEITTPGRGQIRAMIIHGANPVNTGPGGQELDDALASLDLLVSIDLVQRESHRHAHWLIPGVHFLERDELIALLAQMQEQPFVQYSPRAVEPPPNLKPEWEFLIDVAVAMKAPLFGKRGVNGFIKATRLLAKVTRRPGLAFSPHWVERLLVAIGRRLKWKDILAHPHGWIYGEQEFGNVAGALRTPDKRIHVAPTEFVAETRRQLATPIAGPDADYPFLMTSARHQDSLSSHLNELPGLHRHQRFNDVEVNPTDAERLGVSTGDLVRVSSPLGSIELPARVTDAIRPGVVMVPFGWGSRIFDPTGRKAPESYGVNRNLLVTAGEVDPLSMTSPLNTQRVRLDFVRITEENHAERSSGAASQASRLGAVQ